MPVLSLALTAYNNIELMYMYINYSIGINGSTVCIGWRRHMHILCNTVSLIIYLLQEYRGDRADYGGG